MTISLRQNEDRMLRLRAAIAQTYNRPKGTFVLLFVLSLGSVGGSLWNAFHPEGLQELVGLLGVVIVLLDQALRSSTQKDAKEGAQLGNQFDYYVYGVPLPASHQSISPSRITELAGSTKLARFENWYTPRFAQLTGYPQAIACQWENSAWDFYLRCRYELLLRRFLWVYGVFFIVLAGTVNLAFTPSLINIIVPAFPLWYLALTMRQDSLGSLQKLLNIRADTEHLLRNAGAGASAADVERIQEQIYRHRKSAIPIPNLMQNRLAKHVSPQLDSAFRDLLQPTP